jgi:hypothetical protein
MKYAIVIVLVILALAYWWEQRRSDALQTVAQQMGLRFIAGAEPLPEALKNAGFYLFTQGTPRVNNRMEGRRNGYQLMVMDYTYDAEAGENVYEADAHPAASDDVIETRNHTAVWLYDPAARYPTLDINPTGFYKRDVAARLGLSGVGIDHRPDLDKRYTIVAKDPVAARAVLTTEMLDKVLAVYPLVIEVRQHGVLCYYHDARQRAGEVADLVTRCEGIADGLR